MDTKVIRLLFCTRWKRVDGLTLKPRLTLFHWHLQQGSLTANFILSLSTDDLQFDDVHSCASEMFLFLMYHDNWGSPPLLPQQPGCPELVFDTAVFYHNGEDWQCPWGMWKSNKMDRSICFETQCMSWEWNCLKFCLVLPNIIQYWEISVWMWLFT